MENNKLKPSQERSWLKYYSKEAKESLPFDGSIYEAIYESNKDYPANVALIYNEEKITYKELFDNIEAAAKALKACGVQKGDIISVCIPSTPESVYLLYAASKIGAVANMIDVRSSAESIEHYIQEVDSKIVFVLDNIIEKIYYSLPYLNVKTLVKVNLVHQEKVEESQSVNNKKTIEVNYSTFLEMGKLYLDDTFTPCKKEDPVVVEHTGGTTGIPKGVLLSNYAINMIAHHFIISDLKFTRDQKWLNIMPPFIAYGVGNGLHLPLVVGMSVIEVPVFQPEKIDELILKYDPNNFAGVPLHYETLIHSDKLDGYDFSKWVLAGVGGDSMDISLEMEVNRFFKEHNANMSVIKGYGLTEVCAAATVSFCGSNKIGSVGIPFLYNNVGIFSIDDKNEELGTNELGEICLTSPSMMIKYLNNEEETKKVLCKHSDGKIWLHSGDLGYIDEDGALFVSGRLKRVIVRADGFKVPPFPIENVINSFEEVESCKVVAMPDIFHVQGFVPQANILLKKEARKNAPEILEIIKKECINKLADYQVPSDYCFVEEYPRTPIGKVDTAKMEELNKEKYPRLKRVRL